MYKVITNYVSTDPGYEQMKREGVTDQSAKTTKMEQIKKFFRNNYSTIVVTEVTKSKGNDIEADQSLKTHMEVKITSYKCTILAYKF